MATHSSILTCRIPWTEEPGRLQSIGSQRVGHDWSDLACSYFYIKYKGNCIKKQIKKIIYVYAKSLQSCPTLCDPIDGSPPGSPVPGILQARTLEWVAISFSNAPKWKVKMKTLSLHDSMDCSPPSPSVRGIFQARVLEWVAIKTQYSPVLLQNNTLQKVLQVETEWQWNHKNKL